MSIPSPPLGMGNGLGERSCLGNRLLLAWPSGALRAAKTLGFFSRRILSCFFVELFRDIPGCRLISYN